MKWLGKSLLQRLLDMAIPEKCAVCGARLRGSEEHICVSCLSALPFTDTWKNPAENDMVKMFWHQMPIERSCALFYYKSHTPSSQAIYSLKYNGQPDMGRFLGRLLGKYAQQVDFFEGIDAIIPIPLAKRRIEERGYNQCVMIAEGLSEVCRLSILQDAVERVSFLESQTHKNRWQRRENVEQVFRLTGKADLQGKHLLIVDDVCTTGATILACCEELMKAENVKFSVLTVGLTES